MTSLSSALREYRQGQCTMAHVETQIERDIALGVAQADQLLEQLTVLTSEGSLDPDLVDTLRRCILDAETRRRTQIGTAQNDDHTASLKEAFPGGRLRPVKVGDVINGRFILEEEVGRGGMSQVFRATDKRRLEARSRDPVVALKIMTVQGVDPGTAFVAMQREAQKSQQLNHPNILRVNDFDRDGSVVYTTMEFLHGESLQQKIARAAPVGLPLEEAVSIIDSMAQALAYAHENKIIHADFKPSNVFVTTRGVVKVIDFGIARAIQAPDLPDDQRTVFDPRAALGALTPAYASPEMLEDVEPDPRDDVYSLGCVAYELITGRHPFSKLRATDARDGAHPLKRPEALNEPQWQALRHALEFERESRTASVRDFLEEFHRPPGPNLGKLLRPAAAVVAVAVLTLAGVWLWSPDSTQPAPDLIVDCAGCPPLRAVPAGSGEVGLTAGIGPPDSDPGLFERPARRVAIAADFALGTREVTVGEFRAFAEASGDGFSGCRSATSNWQPDPALSWENPGFPQTENHPATCISWSDATAYARWLSARTGERYRLPSETEWEFAARGSGLDVMVNASEDDLCSLANVADESLGSQVRGLRTAECRDGYAYTAPVDRNGDVGFADLRGNVFEWTQDCWNASYQGAPRDGTAWQSGDCASRVLRGGSWYTAPKELRLTYRNRFDIDYRSNTFGFRIARDIR